MDLMGDRLSAFPASLLDFLKFMVMDTGSTDTIGNGYQDFRSTTQRESWEALAPLTPAEVPDQPAGCSPRFK